MSKKMLIFIFVALAVGFVYLYANVPLTVTKYYDGVIYSENGEVEEPVVIALYGKAYGNVFGDNVFEGKITLDNQKEYEIRLVGDKRTHGIITDEINGEKVTIADVYTSEDFREFTGTFKEVNDKYNMECDVTGSASNAVEAKEIKEKIMASKN